MRNAAIIACIAVAIVALGGGFYLLRERPPGRVAAPVSPPWTFYGMVEDQDGRPVDGARVVAQASELVNNPTMVGGLVEREETRQTVIAHSGPDGRFVIQVPERLYQLNIHAVEVAGHDWVIDLAWTLGPPHNAHDNRQFRVRGPYVKCPYYQPDPARPAIFPVHKSGAEKPAGTASRGGVDVQCQYPHIQNVRTGLSVPSSGPGAPKDNADLAAKLQAYVNR
jgi:hypothetical protein